jgi:hypothetical protein
MKCVCNVCCCRFTLLLLLFVLHLKAQRIAAKKANHVSRFLSWNLSTSQGSFESAFFYLLCERRSEWVNVCGGFCGKMQKRQFLLINLSKECICGFFFNSLSFFFLLSSFLPIPSTCFYSRSINFILMACKGYCSRKDIPIDLRSHKFWSLFSSSWIKCQLLFLSVWGFVIFYCFFKIILKANFL